MNGMSQLSTEISHTEGSIQSETHLPADGAGGKLVCAATDKPNDDRFRVIPECGDDWCLSVVHRT